MASKPKYVLLRDGKVFHKFDTMKEAKMALEVMKQPSRLPSDSKYRIKKV